MSQSSAVYQPTTVNYEADRRQERWHDAPMLFLATSWSQATQGPCVRCLISKTTFPIVLMTSCVLCFTLGLVLLIHGATGYTGTDDAKDDFMYLVITIFGAIIFALSILLFVFFMRFTRRICWRNAKDHLNSGGPPLSVNPSTDFLVSAQYAPVSEVVYQPAHEDTEQSKLMQQEKELLNEDTDRMVESDPRIVLRPLNPSAHEEA